MLAYQLQLHDQLSTVEASVVTQLHRQAVWHINNSRLSTQLYQLSSGHELPVRSNSATHDDVDDQYGANKLWVMKALQDLKQ